MIPAEAVEAAVHAYMQYPRTRGRDNTENMFRAALEAAALHMLAGTTKDNQKDEGLQIMTRNNITVSLINPEGEETVAAEYFQNDEGWITFKTAEHKTIASYPAARVISVKGDGDTQPTPVEGSLERSSAIVQEIITDWVRTAADTARIASAGPEFDHGVDHMQHLTLAEPRLVTDRILDALKQSGATK